MYCKSRRISNAWKFAYTPFKIHSLLLPCAAQGQKHSLPGVMHGFSTCVPGLGGWDYGVIIWWGFGEAERLLSVTGLSWQFPRRLILPFNPCVLRKDYRSWLVYWLAWSECTVTGAVVFRRHTAFSNASNTISLVNRDCIDQPITFLENRSSTTARSSSVRVVVADGSRNQKSVVLRFFSPMTKNCLPNKGQKIGSFR